MKPPPTPAQVKVLKELQKKGAELVAYFHCKEPDKVWFAYWRHKPEARYVTKQVTALLQKRYLRLGCRIDNAAHKYAQARRVMLTEKAKRFLRKRILVEEDA